ncbi:MAG TPA: cob(I)yrinic acid a,c-diamide adenosyltransferase [Isosphaeraceae bacterium]|nr:cob(I)yrinic acid a,c-diamide adenosyltransferase [Isosphaeraceae bacterium]
MRIYTRTGDDGTTGFLGNRRVPKDDHRIDAYGTIDELNSVLGVARAQGMDRQLDELVARLQNELFALGSALADPLPQGPYHNVIIEAHVTALEQTIDGLEAELSPLKQFILPGGALPAGQVHLARTVCRRAERLVVKLSRVPGEHVPSAVLVYLNRLSDLLFVLARVLNHRAGVADTIWKGL